MSWSQGEYVHMKTTWTNFFSCKYIHSFISFAINNTYTIHKKYIIYILKMIDIYIYYFTNIHSGNDELGSPYRSWGLYTIGFLTIYGTPRELRVLNEKWIIPKRKEKERKKKRM